MNKRENIDQKYNDLYNVLHEEFFGTLNKDTGKQERALRFNKSANEFNQKLARIDQDREAELETAGFTEPEPTLPMDYKAEIDGLKAEIETLKEVTNGT